MDPAQHREMAFYGEYDLGLAARLLVPRIEAERIGRDIGVVDQLAVVVDDYNGVPSMKGELRRLEGAAFLCNDEWAAVCTDQ